MAPPDVCEIARDALRDGNKCGCDGSEASKSMPQCTVDGKLLTQPPAACSVLALATRRDQYFQMQYDPRTAFENSDLRNRILANIGADVEAAEDKVEKAYGAGAPVGDISYWRMQKCLANADGSPGDFGNKRIDRATLRERGSYGPQPVIGGSFIAGRVPSGLTSLLPVRTDRVMNPSLMFVVLLIVILAVLSGLVSAVAGSPGQAGIRQARQDARASRT
jgi:hypothetical protein